MYIVQLEHSLQHSGMLQDSVWSLTTISSFGRSKNTRANHPYKIQTKLAEVNSFKYSFFVRIAKDWKSLPNHLFTDEINVIKFKRGLKKWMKIY